MQCLIKPHTYSSFMRVSNVTKDGWTTRLKNPLILDDKKKTPLVIWGTFSKVLEIDIESGQPRCIGPNVDHIYALQVDIDNGCTIDEFIKCYHRYSFQLYTSYNHGFKPTDRFRCIFPLKEPIYTVDLVPPVKKILLDMFPIVDESCFDKGHWQCLPCIRSKDAPYHYEQHQGEIMSFANDKFREVAADYREKAHWRREIARADFKPSGEHTGALNWAQGQLDAAVEGTRDKTIFGVLHWLHDTVGATYDEALTLVAPYEMEDVMAKKIETIWNS